MLQYRLRTCERVEEAASGYWALDVGFGSKVNETIMCSSTLDPGPILREI
jgi:hypothetical protein